MVTPLQHFIFQTLPNAFFSLLTFLLSISIPLQPVTWEHTLKILISIELFLSASLPNTLPHNLIYFHIPQNMEATLLLSV